MPNIPTGAAATTDGHTKIIDSMLEIGIKNADVDGTCHGIGFMGVQAILAKTTAAFDDRCNALINTPKNSLVSTIDKTKKKKKRDKTSLTSQEKTILGLPAFLEGIELNHHGYDMYRGLHPAIKTEAGNESQNVMLTHPNMLSATLEAQGGIEKITSYSGRYYEDPDTDDAELTAIFDSLKKSLEKSNFKHPIAFMLSGNSHTISAGYDPENNEWYLINANKLPVQRFSGDQTDKFAEKVLSSLTYGSSVNMISEMFCSAEHANELKPIIASWQRQKAWKKIHEVTPKKAKASLLHVACIAGDEQTIQQCLEQDIEPDHLNEQGLTPLFLAAQYGHANIAKLLLQHGAIPNLKNIIVDMTPLDIAIDNGNVSVIEVLINIPQVKMNKKELLIRAIDRNQPLSLKALLKSGKFAAEIKEIITDKFIRKLIVDGKAEIFKQLVDHTDIDLNQTDSDGNTYITRAIASNQPAITRELLTHGIDPNQTVRSDPLIFIAASLGRTEILRELLLAGADPKKIGLWGSTPMEIAKANKHEGTVKELERYAKNPHYTRDASKLATQYNLEEIIHDTDKLIAALTTPGTMHLRNFTTTALMGALFKEISTPRAKENFLDQLTIAAIPEFIRNATDLRAFLAWAPAEKRLEILSQFNSEWLRNKLTEADELTDIFSKLRDPTDRIEFSKHLTSNASRSPAPRIWLQDIVASDSNNESDAAPKQLNELAKTWGINPTALNLLLNKPAIERASPIEPRRNESKADSTISHQTSRDDLYKLGNLVKEFQRGEDSDLDPKETQNNLRNIQSFTLNRPFKNTAETEMLAHIIQHDPYLKTFSLNTHSVTQIRATLLAEAIADSNLSTIHIDGIFGGIDSVILLLDAMIKNQKCETVLSLNNVITETGLFNNNDKPTPNAIKLVQLRAEYGNNLSFDAATNDLLDTVEQSLAAQITKKITKFVAGEFIGDFKHSTDIDRLNNLFAYSEDESLPSKLRKAAVDKLEDINEISIQRKINPTKMLAVLDTLTELIEQNHYINAFKLTDNTLSSTEANQLTQAFSKNPTLKLIEIDGKFGDIDDIATLLETLSDDIDIHLSNPIPIENLFENNLASSDGIDLLELRNKFSNLQLDNETNQALNKIESQRNRQLKDDAAKKEHEHLAQQIADEDELDDEELIQQIAADFEYEESAEQAANDMGREESAQEEDVQYDESAEEEYEQEHAESMQEERIEQAEAAYSLAHFISDAFNNLVKSQEELNDTYLEPSAAFQVKDMTRYSLDITKDLGNAILKSNAIMDTQLSVVYTLDQLVTSRKNLEKASKRDIDAYQLEALLEPMREHNTELMLELKTGIQAILVAQIPSLAPQEDLYSISDNHDTQQTEAEEQRNRSPSPSQYDYDDEHVVSSRSSSRSASRESNVDLQNDDIESNDDDITNRIHKRLLQLHAIDDDFLSENTDDKNHAIAQTKSLAKALWLDIESAYQLHDQPNNFERHMQEQLVKLVDTIIRLENITEKINNREYVAPGTLEQAVLFKNNTLQTIATELRKISPQHEENMENQADNEQEISGDFSQSDDANPHDIINQALQHLIDTDDDAYHKPSNSIVTRDTTTQVTRLLFNLNKARNALIIEAESTELIDDVILATIALATSTDRLKNLFEDGKIPDIDIIDQAIKFKNNDLDNVKHTLEIFQSPIPAENDANDMISLNKKINATFTSLNATLDMQYYKKTGPLLASITTTQINQLISETHKALQLLARDDRPTEAARELLANAEDLKRSTDRLENLCVNTSISSTEEDKETKMMAIQQALTFKKRGLIGMKTALDFFLQSTNSNEHSAENSVSHHRDREDSASHSSYRFSVSSASSISSQSSNSLSEQESQEMEDYEASLGYYSHEEDEEAEYPERDYHAEEDARDISSHNNSPEPSRSQGHVSLSSANSRSSQSSSLSNNRFGMFNNQHAHAEAIVIPKTVADLTSKSTLPSDFKLSDSALTLLQQNKYNDIIEIEELDVPSDARFACVKSSGIYYNIYPAEQVMAHFLTAHNEDPDCHSFRDMLGGDQIEITDVFTVTGEQLKAFAKKLQADIPANNPSNPTTPPGGISAR